MTTQAGTPRRDRIALHLEYHQLYLKSFVIATIAAMPLGLLLIPGMWRVVGFTYLVTWLVVVLPSSAMFLGLILDATLIMMRRRPILLPTALRAVELDRRHGQSPRRVVRTARRLMLLSIWASPLANLATSMLYSSARLQRDFFMGLFKEVEQAQTEELQVPETFQVAAPTEQLEVLEHEVCTV